MNDALWNGSEPDVTWPAKGEEPALLAVRCGDEGPFDDTFTFTPEGWRLMPEPDGAGTTVGASPDLR